MDRRSLLISAGLWAAGCPTFGAASDIPLAELARQGGVLLIRHATTEPGLGDPPGFALGQCSSQRNLSATGQAEARGIGAWFRRHGLTPEAIFTSQWCRCQDTARLAFGDCTDWPALNSSFAQPEQLAQQLRELHERLQLRTAGTLEVWVTHQVVMTGLTGAYPAMAEGFLVDRNGVIQARGRMTGAWPTAAGRQ